MENVNPIVSFRIDFTKETKDKGILKHSERLLVENYMNLADCAQSLRNRLKKAKSDHFHGKVYEILKSGKEIWVKTF
jgi:hypothetical protein